MLYWSQYYNHHVSNSYNLAIVNTPAMNIKVVTLLPPADKKQSRSGACGGVRSTLNYLGMKQYANFTFNRFGYTLGYHHLDNSIYTADHHGLIKIDLRANTAHYLKAPEIFRGCRPLASMPCIWGITSYIRLLTGSYNVHRHTSAIFVTHTHCES